MTASTLSQLPLMAGSVLLDTMNRAGRWSFARYMKAPLASTGLLAMVTMTALAGSNALFFQTTEHPSPFFVPAKHHAEALPTPAASRPDPVQTNSAEPQAALPQLPAEAPQPAVSTAVASPAPAPAVPDGPVGNAQMFAVQKKLHDLKLFNGKVDGYYGPQTAQAIRTFEQRNGLTMTGANDPKVFDIILKSDDAGRVAQPQAMQTPAPAPVAQPVVQQAAMVTPPPAPVPAAAPAQDQVVAKLPELSPGERVFDGVAQSAANTIDSIVASVDTNRTAQPVANPPTPRASVPVVAQQPMPAPVQAAPAPVAVQQVADIAPTPTATPAPPATDGALVTQIQRGLASLGFFRGPIDGKPGAETARAIREFENFHRYKMTGQVQPDLVDLLIKAGATI